MHNRSTEMVEALYLMNRVCLAPNVALSTNQLPTCLDFLNPGSLKEVHVLGYL